MGFNNEEDTRAAAAGGSAGVSSGGGSTVAVTFFTSHPSLLQAPATTFSVPSGTLPEGLNVLLNDILGLHDESARMPFDFLIKDEYLTVSLGTYLRRRSLSVEDLVHLEYVPALQAQEGSRLPHDDWVATLRAPLCGVPQLLLTGSYDHCVRVWHSDTCLAIGAGHLEAVKSVAVVPGSVVVVEALPPPAADKTSGSGKRPRQADDDRVASFDCVSSSKDGSLRLWHFDANPSQYRLDRLSVPVMLHADAVDTCDVDPSGTLVASGSWDCAVAVTSLADMRRGASSPDATTMTPVYRFTDHARAVLSVRFSPTKGSSHLLYSTGLDGSVKVWDVQEGKLRATITGDHSANGLSVRPPIDGASNTADLIICGHTDNRIRLYDPRSKSVARVMTGHRQWVYSVAWLWRPEEEAHPAGPMTLIASASEDGTVRIWDLRSTSSALVTLDALHNDGVLDVTYVGDAQIASAGKDNKTRTARIDSSTAAPPTAP